MTPLRCLVCGQPVVRTKHGLIHRSRKAKGHNHQPVVEDAVQAAQEVMG